MSARNRELFGLLPASLLVTAVDSVTGGSDAVRSRFVDEVLASGLARHSVGDPSSDEAPAEAPQGRVLALPALVAEASVFAFPSTKEGFGLAAMEALAAGTPVDSSIRQTIAEIVGSPF